MAIVKQLDKRSGITYAYESISRWDKEKKQSRSTRKRIGRVDEKTGEIIATDGRGRKESSGDDEVVKVLSKEAKKRQDAIELYQKGNRTELAQAEQQELDIIKQYLPEQMSPDQVRQVVEQVISSTDQTQFGAVMGAVMKELKGKADGSVVKKVVSQVLES